MGSEQSDSIIKKALKNLCFINGWSYGVFWRFDQRNCLLLTMQDAYYDEQTGVFIDDMLLKIHMFGEGVIGQAAFTKKHRWMFSDANYGQNSVGLSQDMFEDDSEFHLQFSSGIKTIAVISVEPQGVVQFGSTQKIQERTEFVNQTKILFQDMENGGGLTSSENAPSSSNGQSYGPSGLFASLISPQNSYFSDLRNVDDSGHQNLMGTGCSSVNLTRSFSSTSDHSKMITLANSSHFENQFQIAGIEAQILLSNKSDTRLQQSFLQSTTHLNCSATQAPCSSTRSSGDSILTSFEQLPSEIRAQHSQNVFSAKPNSLLSCTNAVENFQDFTFSSLHSEGILVEKNSQKRSGNLMNEQDSAMLPYATESRLPERPTRICTFKELFQEVDYTTDLSASSPLDNFSQWFAPSPDQNNDTLATTLNDDLLSQAMGFFSVSTNLNEGDNPLNIPVNHPADSIQSSITNTIYSDGNGKSSNISKVENDLFDSFGLDFGCGLAGDWDDILMPVVNGGHLDFSTDTSECITEQPVGSTFGPRTGLFSKLGVEQLLDDISGTSKTVVRSSFEDQLSSTFKRRRTVSSLGSSDQVKLEGLPYFAGNMNSLLPVHNLDRTNSPGPKKEVTPKLEVAAWIGDSYGKNAEATVSQAKKHVQPAKATKKKAKRGTRPRPKDRQRIHDCVSELRELVPNGEKLSLDCLLDRTIKHMLFLQSVTKHGDRIKQANEPKENGIAQKDNSSTRGSGVTWACEFGNQTMVCPLIVEDLDTPGQMLIEMLCEEQGFFLEIGDIIRGFGLTILKGVMEVRENNIWARFIVETEETKHVMRHEIFSALVQLLQQMASSGVNVSDQVGNAIDGGTSLLNNYQQSVMPLPVSMAEPLQCISL